MNFRLRISGSQLEISDDTAWWKYSFFLKTWWKYSLRWQFANLVADMVTSQSPISGNRKHWYHNIGRHQCCPWDVLREKDCRKLALGQLLSAEATTRFHVWNSKWSGFTYDQNFARTTEFPVDYYYYYSDHSSLLQ